MSAGPSSSMFSYSVNEKEILFVFGITVHSVYITNLTIIALFLKALYTFLCVIYVIHVYFVVRFFTTKDSKVFTKDH